MGRRKGQIRQMSNSLLVKDKQKRHGQRGNSDSFVHTTELQDGVNYNRINFQSVTEQSNLEDFLNTAEMAGRDFAAERQNISIITDPAQSVRLSADDMKKISNAQQQHKELLRIPRRPPWDEFTSKEQLQLLERDSFTAWRRQLKMLEDQEHIQLTPYEKNLDFWRQLWRVIERSDVVVQIVDARNPLLFRCEDLDTYTKEVNPEKMTVLLVNKADFLNRQQRIQWVEYFNKKGIRAVFFSAKIETEKHEDSDQASQEWNELEDIGEMDEEEDDDSDNEDTEEETKHIVEEESDNRLHTNRLSPPQNTDSTDESNTNQTSVHNKCDNTDLNSLSIRDSTHPESSSKCNVEESKSESTQEQHSNICNQTKDTILLLENSADIVTAEELMDIFRKLSHPSMTARSGDVKTVGMIGYPNVGKSSTINVILKEKKLAVSATPGRTKHLQTLYVDDNLMLCDCPGLVFPSFVATRAHLVINGILPIDELRDHVSPTHLICDQIPRNVLEATYSIMIPRPSVDDESERPPTAEELLNAYGSMRGFMTQRGIPDGPRASRYLLKDYVKGKLLFCNPPPGISAQEFQDKERVLEMEAARPVIKVPLPRIASDIDQDFFRKRQSKINAKGVNTGVKGFVRVDCLKTTSVRTDEDDNSMDGSIGGSCSSLNSLASGVHKPWKKHNNRRKKEKLRKLHRDLDIH